MNDEQRVSDTTVVHREVADNLEAYALGALDPDETRAAGEHLTGCLICRNRLAELDAAIDHLLTIDPIEPPVRLRAALLAEIAADAPSAEAPLPFVRLDAKHRNLIPALAIAAAIALLVVSALLLSRLRDAEQRSDTLSSRSETLAAYLVAGGRSTVLQPVAGGFYEQGVGRGVLLTAPGLPPLLVMDDCPQLGDGSVYKVWFAKSGSRRPVGEIGVDSSGFGSLPITADADLAQSDQIGVSVIDAAGGRTDVMIGGLSGGITG